MSLSESPYSYSWNTESYAEDNEHDISAKVNDLEGNFFNIQPITVTVNNDPSINDNIPPVVSILSPISGMSVSDSVEVKIFAQDNHGVEQVLLTVDTLEITLTDSPYVVKRYAFGSKVTFKVFLENEAKFYLPRFYALEKFGIPDENYLVDRGEDLNSSAKFTKTLRPHQVKKQFH